MQHLLIEPTMTILQFIIVMILFVLSQITLYRILNVWQLEEEEYYLEKYGYNKRE